MSNTIQTPENFNELASAISQLSKDFGKSVTDLIQRVRVREEIIANHVTGNIEIAVDYSDMDAREYGIVFVMDPRKNFHLTTKLGEVPEGWNVKALNATLFKFADFIAHWQPVHSILFCPHLSTRDRYTPRDLKESYMSPQGWVINIRGMFNDGDDYDTGLPETSEENLFG